MAVNTDPAFVIRPHNGLARISTANTNRDGTGTLGSVITGATDSTRVDRVEIKATGTTTAGMIRLFVFDGVSTTLLFREIVVSAITVGSSTPSFGYTVTSPDINAPLLMLPSGYILKAGTHNAETFDVIALGGDYS